MPANQSLSRALWMQTPSQLGWYATVSLLSQHHNLNHTADPEIYIFYRLIMMWT